jgi:hypothetical protein
MKSWIAEPSRRNSGFEAHRQDALDPAPGADRHRRFGHDHRAVRRQLSQRVGDLGGGGEDVGEVGVAVAAARRRAHRDEYRLGAVERSLEIGRERQASGRGVD